MTTQTHPISISGKPFETIEAAVAAATAGDTVQLGPGVFNVAGDLRLPSDISLKSVGGATILRIGGDLILRSLNG